MKCLTRYCTTARFIEFFHSLEKMLKSLFFHKLLFSFLTKIKVDKLKIKLIVYNCNLETFHRK